MLAMVKRNVIAKYWNTTVDCGSLAMPSFYAIADGSLVLNSGKQEEEHRNIRIYSDRAAIP